uniref:DYW domain-containing protein n=1 Tax=Oryza rufipogon TaxID=4529 RepID=A0A0E0Q3B9_ORYRU
MSTAAAAAAAAAVQPVLPSSSASTGGQQHGVLTADRVAGLLTGCATLRRTGELHAAAVRAGVDGDRAVGFRLQRAYAASGRLDLTVTLLRLTPDPTTVFYTSAIHAHSSRGLHLAALALLSEMLVTAMLTCYAKMGALDDARELFDGMPSKDFICWNAMIDGYTQHGRPNEALRLFRWMLRSGVDPDEVAIILALSAVAQLGTAESGRWLHSYVKNSRRVQLNARVGTALIDMYCKCGSLEDAVSVFNSIGDKDIVVWNAMINGYAMHGDSRKALEMFSQLRSQGLWPTDITFIGLLNACSHSGLVDEGRQFFQSMEEEYAIVPKIEHSGCMVDLLGRAGLIEEAFHLVQSMTIAPDTVMWVSLLAACRLHKNMALGQQIADYLVAGGLANSGMYILLSNIYAAVGNWEEVARVRSMMKASGIQKEPGCSAIEVGRKVYEFVAGDMSHPRTDEIYAMLEKMNGIVKEQGHVPQTELVLHDLDEVTKEKALAVHSEKLAVAFGLISTAPGETIKIVKNLRACADCHAVLKLISKITGRKIVFRDRNRFHHFVDGSCTCGDYW